LSLAAVSANLVLPQILPLMYRCGPGVSGRQAFGYSAYSAD